MSRSQVSGTAAGVRGVTHTCPASFRKKVSSMVYALLRNGASRQTAITTAGQLARMARIIWISRAAAQTAAAGAPTLWEGHPRKLTGLGDGSGRSHSKASRPWRQHLHPEKLPRRSPRLRV